MQIIISKNEHSDAQTWTTIIILNLKKKAFFEKF